MGRKPMNIFLHFLNKDTQEIFGLPDDGTPHIHSLFRRGLNASILLCDVETYCFLPLGFWFESRPTKRLLTESKEYIEMGYLRFSTREEGIQEFIEKKREQYYQFYKDNFTRGAYQDFFDENVFRELLTLNPTLMDRRSKIGQVCSTLWTADHNQLILDNSGDLLAIYSLIPDISDREKIAKTIIGASKDLESPFVWNKVRDLFSSLRLRDQSLEKQLRIYFEKNYYAVYLNEYAATNLYNFYNIDKGIDFNFGLHAGSIANFRWFETFLGYLHLGSALNVPAWKIVEIKLSPFWAVLLQKYVDICNIPSNFDSACGTVLTGPDSLVIQDLANKIREILNTNREGLYLPKINILESKIDVLIMVATVEEEKAITNNDVWETAKTADGYEYFIHREGMCFALARAIDMGMESGATATQYYVSELKPRFLAMAGFSAGKRGSVNLGDVIVPDKVYQYGSGKQVSETDVLPELKMFRLEFLWKQKIERFGNAWRKTNPLPKPISYESQMYWFLKKMIDQNFSANIVDLKKDEKLPDIIRIVNEHIEKGWLKPKESNIVATKSGKEKYFHDFYYNYPGEYHDPELETLVGVLATGNTVQQWDGIFQKLESEYDRKTCVLDMEGYAIADVAKFNRIPYLIAKGVGDFASTEKAFDNRYIPYSVFSAYRFLVAFFNKLSGQELFGR